MDSRTQNALLQKTPHKLGQCAARVPKDGVARFKLQILCPLIVVSFTFLLYPSKVVYCPIVQSKENLAFRSEMDDTHSRTNDVVDE